MPTLMNIYHVSAEEADFYFRNLWFVVHSLPTMIVTGDYPYSKKEIEQLLTGFNSERDQNAGRLDAEQSLMVQAFSAFSAF